ncbi:hypothetical protein [Chitinophaga sp. S165]|uniref:hypothetical protein n=1 Tax=Chitinophaga sp. S165 TaxID=2135462 RepID=UPI000D708FE3|nr:hypothetical protein [Chitinophaga sp. S165]PWV54038.1 hypothetical protein C7475_102793 [Chitinophaga sp. S165]
MRKAIKDPNSTIIVDGLSYIPKNSANNKKIEAVLLQEQKNYCAYTDEYMGRPDAKDIEHFNPTLKNTQQDSYFNWYVVKHQWNKEKGSKWANFQPVLHPDSVDFEDRVLYYKGDYIAKSNDIEASNLIKLLKLDDQVLADRRKRYIKNTRTLISIYGADEHSFFNDLIGRDPEQIHYPRAIKEEFKVDIWSMLP